MKNEFLSESGGVSVVDDIPLEDKEAMDEFNFLNSEDGDWNPNREKIESMKNQLAQERRRKRPPRNPNVGFSWPIIASIFFRMLMGIPEVRRALDKRISLKKTLKVSSSSR